MSATSVRRNLPILPRGLEDPPEGERAPAIPDGRGEGCDMDGPEADFPVAGRLWRENGKVMYQGAGNGGPAAVRVLWARPLSGRGGPVSVMLADKKKEVAFLPSLDALSPESRRVAEEELASGMVMPRITRIVEVRPRFGNYYWTVETDRGNRGFLMTSPENSSARPFPDALVVRDVVGNCYEITPVSGLDRASLRELDRVL